MINDPCCVLRTEIRSLFAEVNAMYRHTTIQLPIDLNDLTPLELAELYHELRNMLP